MPPRPRIAVALVLVLAGGLAGCAHSPEAARTDQNLAAATIGVGYDSPVRIHYANLLRMGMHKPQVLAWMGEPGETTAANNANGMRETWTYEIVHPPIYKTIVATMEEVPYMDPFTGELKWLEEPVLNQQRLQRIDTITLTFRGPRIIDLAREVDVNSHFRN